MQGKYQLLFPLTYFQKFSKYCNHMQTKQVTNKVEWLWDRGEVRQFYLFENYFQK